jgi:hypothetical protein
MFVKTYLLEFRHVTWWIHVLEIQLIHQLKIEEFLFKQPFAFNEIFLSIFFLWKTPPFDNLSTIPNNPNAPRNNLTRHT